MRGGPVHHVRSCCLSVTEVWMVDPSRTPKDRSRIIQHRAEQSAFVGGHSEGGQLGRVVRQVGLEFGPCDQAGI
jgi:hypothetical protein